MRRQYGSLVALLCMLGAVHASGDELAEASVALCEKVKSCAIAQMEGQEMTPQVREMMQPMLDSMCEQVQSRVAAVPTGHALYQPAVACMQSMSSLSCEMMQDSGDMSTPACESFEKLVAASEAQ